MNTHSIGRELWNGNDEITIPADSHDARELPWIDLRDNEQILIARVPWWVLVAIRFHGDTYYVWLSQVQAATIAHALHRQDSSNVRTQTYVKSPLTRSIAQIGAELFLGTSALNGCDEHGEQEIGIRWVLPSVRAWSSLAVNIPPDTRPIIVERLHAAVKPTQAETEWQEREEAARREREARTRREQEALREHEAREAETPRKRREQEAEDARKRRAQAEDEHKKRVTQQQAEYEERLAQQRWQQESSAGQARREEEEEEEEEERRAEEQAWRDEYGDLRRPPADYQTDIDVGKLGYRNGDEPDMCPLISELSIYSVSRCTVISGGTTSRETTGTLKTWAACEIAARFAGGVSDGPADAFGGSARVLRRGGVAYFDCENPEGSETVARLRRLGVGELLDEGVITVFNPRYWMRDDDAERMLLASIWQCRANLVIMDSIRVHIRRGHDHAASFTRAA